MKIKENGTRAVMKKSVLHWISPRYKAWRQP